MKLNLFAACLLLSPMLFAADREEQIKTLMQAQGLLATFEQQLALGRQQNREQGQLMLDQFMTNLNPPPEYRAQFEAAFDKYLQALSSPWSADELVAVWARHFGGKFTSVELEQLIAFYSSDLGQKEVAASRAALIQFSTHFAEAAKPLVETTFQDFSNDLQAIAKQCNCARRAAHTEQPQPAEDDDALDALLDRARALNKQGNYADALDRYLEFFELSRGTSYAGVRLSYVPAEIAAMGKHYPAATAALRDLRDARERPVLDGRPTWDEVHEWSSLSEYLEGTGYVADKYDMLKRRGHTDPVVLATILKLNWKEFVDAGRYRELESLAFQKLSQLDMAIDSWDQYAGQDSADAETGKAVTDYLLDEYVHVYEVLLATENTEKARAVAETLLSVNASGATYHALIKAAQAAGKSDSAALLTDEARANLSPAEFVIAVEGEPKAASCDAPAGGS